MPAGLGQQRNRHRADAARRARDQDFSARRSHALFSSASTASMAVNPAVPMAMAWAAVRPAGKRHEPVAFDPRFLRIAAEMRFAEAPARQNHRVAGLEPGMGEALDRAGEINAGNHRKTPHDRRLPVIASPSL